MASASLTGGIPVRFGDRISTFCSGYFCLRMTVGAINHITIFRLSPVLPHYSGIREHDSTGQHQKNSNTR
jgi:hypothetical protein